jgi:tetratricopeptide (TPR) repeat protein
MEMGLIYQQQGEHTAAIEAFERVLSLSPSFRDAFMALAKEYLLMNRPQEAIKILEKVLILQPDDGFGYLTLGKLYEVAGERGKAQDLYRKVLTLDPSKERNSVAISLAGKELERFR